MSELTSARDTHRLDLEIAQKPARAQLAHAQLPHAQLDCEGCPVAAGEVPDASCAECVVSVFLAAEPWPDDGA